ncbi:MAG: hypothetical protein N2749_03265 [Clostridia bacterium]|nr:hypothetical protein [Clostridia bacterium]
MKRELSNVIWINCEEDIRKFMDTEDSKEFPKEVFELLNYVIRDKGNQNVCPFVLYTELNVIIWDLSVKVGSNYPDYIWKARRIILDEYTKVIPKILEKVAPLTFRKEFDKLFVEKKLSIVK